MEIMVNELSLDGTFVDLEEFWKSLRNIIKLQEIMKNSTVTLLKHHELYHRKITSQHTLYDVFKDNSFKITTEIRVFKRLLRNLMNDHPFWTDDQKHKSTDIYKCDYTVETHGYSLAEACERDKYVLSFDHNLFKQDTLNITKNGTNINILNIYEPIVFTEWLYELGEIDPIIFCRYRFVGTNLSFEYMEEKFGFGNLELNEIRAFISIFKMFVSMDWGEINKHDGLDYKPYNPSSKKRDWFLNSPHNNRSIYKFRVSEKYRCFGFREEDTFYVLRFETDHKVSDHG
jgi:hypothetical protein